MDDNETLQAAVENINTTDDVSTPEAIMQQQIDKLVSEVKRLNSELAYTKVELLNKDIELSATKALLDSNTKAAKQEPEYTELIDENNLSEALMSGKY